MLERDPHRPTRVSPTRRQLAFDHTLPEMPAEQSPIGPQIDASQSPVASAIRNLLIQVVLILGVIVSALGLPDASVLKQVTIFLQSAPGLALIGLIGTAGSSLALLYRAWKKQGQLNTFALLPNVPDRVAVGPANPTPTVARAVEAATAIIDGTPPPAGTTPTPNRR